MQKIRSELFTVPTTEIMARSARPMLRVRKEIDELSEYIARCEPLVKETMAEQLAALRDELSAISTPITFVGQVKAGKTALVNVLTGRRGLLPSDVNPWTSVVTTVHVNGVRPKNVRAEFAFFEKDEWDNLIKEGGRLGQMAARAGADDEIEQIRSQIEQMRSKSRQRLGRNFELLLGHRHKYDSFDGKLIERYVCLGDQDDEGSDQAGQGRFADITRSADLYLDIPAYPIAFSLQDTPGVNDPFLMREQITLRSINSASLCVVVLSAAQAMNRVDLALVQLLCAMESRQVIIFVNRIDELSDPAAQVEEIRESLQTTLDQRGIGAVGHIIFGSARWAEAALEDDLDGLPQDSRLVLNKMYRARPGQAGGLNADMAWTLSGIPELQSAIADTIAETSGQRIAEGFRRRLRNIVTGAIAQHQALCAPTKPRLDRSQIDGKLANLKVTMDGYLAKDMARVLAVLNERLEQSSKDFVTQTVNKLVDQAVRYGPSGQERLEPMQLRMRYRTAYIKFSADLRSLFETIGTGTTEALIDLYGQMLGELSSSFELSPPQPPIVPPPVAIGRTIIVDLETSWWKSWMATRISTNTLAKDYRRLVEAEVGSICGEIMDTARGLIGSMIEQLNRFLDEQGKMAMAVGSGADLGEASVARSLMARGEALTALDGELRRLKRGWSRQEPSSNVVGFRDAV